MRILLLVAALLAASGATAAAPCTTATPNCTEWITPGGATGRFLIYRNHALEQRNAAITRALIMVHGLGRDADSYYRSTVAAAFLAGALEDTVVIATRFASTRGGPCQDKVAADEMTWQCQPRNDTWRTGGAAVENPNVTSFDIVDEILRKLARKDTFPNLKSAVVAGHSAGGQFVSRYEMANRVHGALGVEITYVVANPSSYAYLDATRPTATVLSANVAAAAPGYHAGPPAKPPAPYAAYADAAGCTAYDHWPYGMQDRNGYAARLPDEQLRKQLAERPTTYLLGELDILPLYGFDSSCSAMAQGPTRLARGLAFLRYVNEKFGAQHRAVIVPACGHSARCMFTHDISLPLLFPK